MRPIYGIVAAILPLAVLAQSNRTYSLEKFEFEGGPEAWGNDCESLSMNCGTAVIEEDNDYHKEGKLMRYLKEKLYSLPPDRVYPSGKHIACYLYSHGPHGFCLFFENLPRGTNHTVGEASTRLWRSKGQEKMATVVIGAGEAGIPNGSTDISSLTTSGSLARASASIEAHMRRFCQYIDLGKSFYVFSATAFDTAIALCSFSILAEKLPDVQGSDFGKPAVERFVVQGQVHQALSHTKACTFPDRVHCLLGHEIVGCFVSGKLINLFPCLETLDGLVHDLKFLCLFAVSQLYFSVERYTCLQQRPLHAW